jgi:hypothetical protein
LIAASVSSVIFATSAEPRQISGSRPSLATFKIEADITGSGKWFEFASLQVKPDEVLKYSFPDAFAAYWLRVTSSADATATAQLDCF